MQRINLEQAAEGGYVPLSVDPDATAQTLEARVQLRGSLGMASPESTREALADHGFVTNGSSAYLPVGLDHDQLLVACRPNGPIERAVSLLRRPVHLECVLVTSGPGGLRGVNVDTGKEVPVQ